MTRRQARRQRIRQSRMLRLLRTSRTKLLGGIEREFRARWGGYKLADDDGPEGTLTPAMLTDWMSGFLRDHPTAAGAIDTIDIRLVE